FSFFVPFVRRDFLFFPGGFFPSFTKKWDAGCAPPPPPPAGMGKHQDGGIKRGMAENLPFQSFIHILFLKFAFAGRRAANAGVR
ncbi:hypothetical protein, partial [Neisseria gonorrhoeae]|uniref:hypothetical protein n=1 Tax=Neisseria gonorrhoeae TaxID=485 RepID=UPI00201DD673